MRLKNTIPAIFAVGMVCMLAGCGFGNDVSPNNAPSDGDTLTLSFQLDNERSLTGKATETSTAPTEVVYVDITKKLPEYIHAPLVEGENLVELPKDGIYVLALVGREAAASETSSAVEPRSISDAISMIGNISIVSNGLDSLPVKGESRDSLDLGTLLKGDGTYNSGIDSTVVEDALSYSSEALASYSIFDKSLLKVMNPDINKNGVYDDEEELVWRLTSFRTFIFYDSEFNLGSNNINVPLDRFQADDFTLVFWGGSGFPHPSCDDVLLTLPDNYTYYDNNGAVITAVHPDSQNEPDTIGNDIGNMNQYYFTLAKSISSPDPPYSGDYTLDIGGELYYFRNVEYVSTEEYRNGGMMIPFCELEFDENGLLLSLTRKWYKIVNDVYVPASPEEVRLQIASWYTKGQTPIEFWSISTDNEHEEFGIPYYESATVDLSSLGIHYDDFGSGYEEGVDYNGKILECQYWDRSGNCFDVRIYFKQ